MAASRIVLTQATPPAVRPAASLHPPLPPRRERLEPAAGVRLKTWRGLLACGILGGMAQGGLSATLDGAAPFQIHEGKVTRVVADWDRDRVFAHLGLAQ